MQMNSESNYKFFTNNTWTLTHTPPSLAKASTPVILYQQVSFSLYHSVFTWQTLPGPVLFYNLLSVWQFMRLLPTNLSSTKRVQNEFTFCSSANRGLATSPSLASAYANPTKTHYFSLYNQTIKKYGDVEASHRLDSQEVVCPPPIFLQIESQDVEFTNFSHMTHGHTHKQTLAKF